MLRKRNGKLKERLINLFESLAKRNFDEIIKICYVLETDLQINFIRIYFPLRILVVFLFILKKFRVTF